MKKIKKTVERVIKEEVEVCIPEIGDIYIFKGNAVLDNLRECYNHTYKILDKSCSILTVMDYTCDCKMVIEYDEHFYEVNKYIGHDVSMNK